MTLPCVTLWLALSVVIYAYVGFPVLLVVRGVLARPIRKSPSTPSLTLVIIAHNEQEVIAEKLQNAISLDYPREKLEILVGSDGSDDRTNEIVQGFEQHGVRLVACPRQGKISTLNETVAQAQGEILVFSDANSMYEAGSLKAIAACFSDPNVGGVAGDQVYTTDKGNAGSLGERIFWNFDRFLKRMQSRSGSVTSSTGAIHAVRRELFEPVPSGVCDDFLISTRVVAKGYRLVFEPGAIAYEEVAASDKAEFRRKSRIIARGIRGLWVMRTLLNPLAYGFYSFQLASHKLLRWSVIFLLPVILLLNLACVEQGFVYQLLLGLQLAFYFLALIGIMLRNTPIFRNKLAKIMAVPYFFCMANFSALSGWYQFLTGRRVDIWNSNRVA
ncbi:Poly-beta-1,6-N-acetyl-D-glucosamine synthase [Bremerella volcania]|uniref:Poly-beta-1,6-N-acetyl-D-glucosamine synthase n=1 Tax=Bremerella volcania TaxID=2527984 RepID=A0A518C952_9BACT|nr:glycosyltransferase family 2 protein [Bremerella volcania]QDU75742.1 Poly-beta-1,6-N-acetyl-D-glucosamine synthase [Bremerella volcania]